MFSNPYKKWDKCLDDYENYTKEYIKQYKKSLKGNGISLCKYPYMKAKSEALCEQLNTAQDKDLLSKKQLKRILKIQLKWSMPANFKIKSSNEVSSKEWIFNIFRIEKTNKRKQ